MWTYSFVTREEFEKRKDAVEVMLRQFGCETARLSLPYTCHGRNGIPERPIYRFGDRYIRIDEILFEKPFLVLEIADTLKEVMDNAMEDADPFPYDLEEDQMLEEIRRTLVG